MSLTIEQLYFSKLLDEKNRQVFVSSPTRQNNVDRYFNSLDEEQKKLFINTVIDDYWNRASDEVKWFLVNLSDFNQIIKFDEPSIVKSANLFWNQVSEIEKWYFNLLDDINKKQLINFSRDTIVSSANEYYQRVKTYKERTLEQTQQTYQITTQAQKEYAEREMLRKAELIEQQEKQEARVKLLEMIPGFKESYLTTLSERPKAIKTVKEEFKPIEAVPKKTESSNRLTKYEVSLLVGKRALMLEQNTTPTIDPGEIVDPEKIALMELRNKRLPLNLERPIIGSKLIEIKNPNKMILPEEIMDKQDFLTKDEAKNVIKLRIKDFEAGQLPNIDLRKIAIAELQSGRLIQDKIIPEEWNIDKFNYDEVRSLIKQRVDMLNKGGNPNVIVYKKELPETIANIELKEGVLPINKFERANGDVVDPNMMTYPGEQNPSKLTNDEVILLIKKRMEKVPELKAIAEFKSKRLPLSLNRGKTMYDVNNLNYPHKFNSLNEILSWFELEELINERASKLKYGSKSLLSNRDLAILELKMGKTPLKIKRDEEYLDVSELLYPN